MITIDELIELIKSYINQIMEMINSIIDLVK